MDTYPITLLATNILLIFSLNIITVFVSVSVSEEQKFPKEGQQIDSSISSIVCISKYNGSTCKNGIIKYINGDTYTGRFIGSKPYGRGILQSNDKSMVYEGEWMDGKKHKGIMTITKNNETIKADGEWKENLGRGDITYQDNSKYNGEWKFNPDNNTIVHQGQGKLKRKDHIFEGRWNNNNFDEGIHITLKDNKVTGTYKGKFVTKNNGGVYPIQCSYKTDEYIYTGSWHNNGMFNNGHVQFTQGDKERINGAWNEDKSGKGTIIYKDGSRYEGDLKFLQRHGNGTMYDKDGNIVIQATWNYDIIYQS